MGRRVIRRKFTKPTTSVKRETSYDEVADWVSPKRPDPNRWAHLERGTNTLVDRFRAVKPGEGLYPYARTKLEITASGKRRWVAKRPDELIP